MPPISDQRREAQRRRIEDAALKCAAEKGFEGATMADIIAEAEMSAGAVYNYYSSKAELIQAVGRRLLAERLESVELPENSAPEPPHQLIPRFIESIFEGLPHNSMILQVWGQASHDPAFEEFTTEIINSIAERLASHTKTWLKHQGMGAEEAETSAKELAPALLALAQGAIVQESLGNAPAGQAARRSITTMLKELGL